MSDWKLLGYTEAGIGVSDPDPWVRYSVVAALDRLQPDPEALTRFLIERLAYFMVPRYIRYVDEIPKTETNKPRKVPFRETGITDDTWDREAHGIVLKKERFRTPDRNGSRHADFQNTSSLP